VHKAGKEKNTLAMRQSQQLVGPAKEVGK